MADDVITKEYFGFTIKVPSGRDVDPDAAPLHEWLWAQGFDNRDAHLAMGAVHAWLTSYAEARCDLLEALAELERK